MGSRPFHSIKLYPIESGQLTKINQTQWIEILGKLGNIVPMTHVQFLSELFSVADLWSRIMTKESLYHHPRVVDTRDVDNVLRLIFDLWSLFFDLWCSGFRPRLSSPIYSISSDSGGGKKSESLNIFFVLFMGSSILSMLFWNPWFKEISRIIFQPNPSMDRRRLCPINEWALKNIISLKLYII